MIAQGTYHYLEQQYDRVMQRGVRLVSRDDLAYPPLLLQTSNPSPLLYVRGTLLPVDRWAVAIVTSVRDNGFKALEGIQMQGRFLRLMTIRN